MPSAFLTGPLSTDMQTVAKYVYSRAQLLPDGAQYVTIPPGYPLDLIVPYITKDGKLCIPNGQAKLSDTYTAWLMIPMQAAINKLSKKPYDINFYSIGPNGIVDDTGHAQINAQTDPYWVSFHGGMSSQPGWVNQGNWDFLTIDPTIQPVQPNLSVVKTISIAVASYINPVAGAGVGAIWALSAADTAKLPPGGNNLPMPISITTVNAVVAAIKAAAATGATTGGGQIVVANDGSIAAQVAPNTTTAAGTSLTATHDNADSSDTFSSSVSSILGDNWIIYLLGLLIILFIYFGGDKK